MEKIRKKQIQTICSLTPVQEGMLFHYLKEPDSKAYIEQLSLTLTGEMKSDVFVNAWNHIIREHEMLRTFYRWKEVEKPVQVTLKEFNLQPVFRNLEGLEDSEKDNRIKHIKETDADTPFDLQKIPFRITLITCEPGLHELIISNHHIIYDGWSTGIIVSGFLHAYRCLSAGKPLTPSTKATFKDFVQWLRSQDRKRQEQFWKEYLKGFDTVTPLSIKEKGKTGDTVSMSETLHCRLEPSFKDQLDSYARTQKVTVAAILYTAWGLLLGRYNLNDDIVFGTTVSGRSADSGIKNIEDIVGLFISTVPLRVRIDEEEQIRVAQLLSKVHRQFQERVPFEHTSLVDIKEYCGFSSDEELFDTLVVIENYPIKTGAGTGGLVLDSFQMKEMTHYDLTLEIMMDDGLNLTFSYKVDKFDRNRMIRMGEHLENLIKGIIAQPHLNATALEILSQEEKDRVVRIFNDTENQYPAQMTIPQLVEAQVEKNPDSTATVGPVTAVNPEASRLSVTTLTNRELDRKANRLARKLQASGLTKGAVAAFLLHPSINVPLTIIAILKAGGTYVPIDPSYPYNRIKWMIDASNAALIITTSDIAEKDDLQELWQPRETPFQLIRLDRLDEQLKQYNDTPLNIDYQPNDLIYIIFTSGSTGKPKGAGVYQGSFVNLNYYFLNTYGLNSLDKTLLLTSSSFDLTQKNFYLPLLTGGVLYFPTVQLFDPPAIIKDTGRYRITWLNCTPSMFYRLVDFDTVSSGTSLTTLRYAFLGGEPIAMVQLISWLESNRFRTTIVNTYGPTECTDIVGTLIIEEPRRYLDIDIPIGKPIDNVKFFVVNRRIQLQPVGVPGELLVAGHCVGFGYIGDEKLTKQKFVYPSEPWDTRDSSRPQTLPDPIDNRYYRTGDLAVTTEDGQFIFLGRIDNQVKIRGFRIELGEIEKRLNSHQLVKEAILMARSRGAGHDDERYLCAYIVPLKVGTLEEQELRNYLSNDLPDYMVPDYFVFLEKMPLNPNGKVNRKALPEPQVQAGSDYIAPRNETEISLVDAWAAVLGLDKDKIGIHTNFFELGGHSLKVMSLVAKIQKEYDVKLSMVKIFNSPTTAKLMELIEAESKKNLYTAIEPQEVKGYYPLSSAQKRFYLAQQMNLENTAYNMPATLELPLDFSREKLEKMFNTLILRHESLRTSFKIINNEPAQIIHETVPFTLHHFQLSTGQDVSGVIEDFITPFDLSVPPLFRAGLIDDGQQKILVVDIHHIISDGVSLQILTREFNALSKEMFLPQLTIQYKDYAFWQSQSLEMENYKEMENYWLKTLEDLKITRIPGDNRAQEGPAVGSCQTVVIQEDTSQQIDEFCGKNQLTRFSFMLSIFLFILIGETGENDLTIGTPIDNRVHPDLENVIGVFLNVFLLRVKIDENASILDNILKVNRHVVEALEYGTYPYEELYYRLKDRYNLQENELFTILFNYLAGEDEARNLKDNPEDLSLAPLELTPKYPVTVYINDMANRAFLNIVYRADLYSQQRIERIVHNYLNFIHILLADKDRLVSDLVYQDLETIGSLQEMEGEFDNDDLF